MSRDASFVSRASLRARPRRERRRARSRAFPSPRALSHTVHTKRDRVIDIDVDRDIREQCFVLTLVVRRARGAARRRATGDADDRELFLHFGLTRESVKEWMCLEELPPGVTYDDETKAMRLKFDSQAGRATVRVPEYVAPASLDFVLYDRRTEAYDEPSSAFGGSAFSVPLGFGCGSPRVLGATSSAKTTAGSGSFSLAVLSRHATAVALVLQWRENTMEIALNPVGHRTGNVWHAEVPYGGEWDCVPTPTAEEDVLYGYRCEGDVEGRGGSRFFPAQVLFDPRAIGLKAPLSEFEEPTPTPRFMGSLYAALEQSVVGEASTTRGAEREAPIVAIDVDVETLTSEGTLRAAAEALAEKRSRVRFNAVALAPLLARCADGRPDAPVSFFAIDPRFGTRADLRAFVESMDAIGVEVWMRCVLTQTGEGTDSAPRSESLRGIDAASYFQIGRHGGLESAGVPLTTALNPCSVPTITLLTDALRSFALYEGVSSFIIESGGGIARGPLGRSPLLEKLAHDPVLGNAAKKLWLTPSEFECGSMPSWGVIGERNSKFSRAMMRFFQGQSGMLNEMALRLGGSPDVFNGLRDARHGLNALELPRSQTVHEETSSEYGTPRVPSYDAAARAALAAAFTANGGVLMDVRDLADESLVSLASALAEFRTRRADIFADDNAYDSITWIDPYSGASPRWDAADAAPALACSRSSKSPSHDHGDVWIAYNGTAYAISCALPPTPPSARWVALIDTSLVDASFAKAERSPSAAVSRAVLPACSVVIYECLSLSPAYSPS